MKKTKYSSRYYLQKVANDLRSISMTPKTDVKRYNKLKRRAAKNLEIAKELMKSE